jgi:hypothetical protein
MQLRHTYYAYSENGLDPVPFNFDSSCCCNLPGHTFYVQVPNFPHRSCQRFAEEKYLRFNLIFCLLMMCFFQES